MVQMMPVCRRNFSCGEWCWLHRRQSMVLGAFDPGHELTFSRAAGSTGTITLVAPGFTIQALAGTVGGSTTIPAHSAAGAGVSNRFVLVGTVWYRIS